MNWQAKITEINGVKVKYKLPGCTFDISVSPETRERIIDQLKNGNQAGQFKLWGIVGWWIKVKHNG